jgi:hypothetical protein
MAELLLPALPIALWGAAKDTPWPAPAVFVVCGAAVEGVARVRRSKRSNRHRVGVLLASWGVVAPAAAAALEAPCRDRDPI